MKLARQSMESILSNQNKSNLNKKSKKKNKKKRKNKNQNLNQLNQLMISNKQNVREGNVAGVLNKMPKEYLTL